MTATAAPLPASVRQIRPPSLGMALFILTESTLFAMLFVSYYYLRSTVDQWPPEGVEKPNLVLPVIGTAILLASSGTILWAERGSDGGDLRQLRIGLALTFLLGAGFLALQGWEWSHAKMSASDNAYASLFFTVTGFHGAHVIAGLAMNGYSQAASWAGRINPRSSTMIKNVSWYWHFVDVVWLFVLSTVYLSPYLIGR